jgi:hypothetical protein
MISEVNFTQKCRVGFNRDEPVGVAILHASGVRKLQELQQLTNN